MNNNDQSSNPFDLSGRVALVTGGGSGLGRQFAITLASAGATVAVCGRRLEPLQETVELIKNQGGLAYCTTMDVNDADDMTEAFERICSEAGAPDILVNNAGVNRPKFVTQLSLEDFDLVFNTNVRGCFALAKMFGERLISEGREGSIINTASVLALRSQKATSPYMAAKAALVHMTRGFAIEWASYGIRVNALAPGYFRTDITGAFLDSPPGQKIVANTPMKRGGELSELDGPLLLLASDAGSFMTGEVLVVDGGLSVSSI